MKLKNNKMKRIVLLLATAIFFVGVTVKAQTTVSAVNYSSLEKKIDKSDKDIQNEKKAAQVKTWTDRAELLVDVYNVHNDVLYKNMSTTEAKILLPNPKIETSQEGADQIEKYIYDRVTLTFRNGKLESWTETNPIVSDPLSKARTAVDEAISLNTEGNEDNRIQDAIAKLQKGYEMEAVLEYEKDSMEASYEDFTDIIDLYDLPVMSGIPMDTLILYNAGRTAIESDHNKEAVGFFEKLDEMNYNEPYVYVYLEQSLMAIGDTAKAVQYIDKGFNKYPDNQAIMNEMINYYITTGQTDQALKLLDVAKQKDPNNVSYVFAEAAMYDRIGDADKAEEISLQCLDMNPDFYDAAYNIGVLFYNKAVKYYEEASRTSDNAEFQKLETEGDDMLKDAIPYMERASQIDPNDIYSLQNLKNMYYRLEMTDKYEEVVKKLEALQQ